MFATFFEWEIREGAELQFEQAWAEATEILKTHGSMGSALFRNDTGNLCAFARWPDRARRDAAFAAAELTDCGRRMGDAIATTVHRIDLEEVRNLWTG
ncbi:MAG: hypothetical protein ABIN83_08130 [Sphingomicrobium sp.]